MRETYQKLELSRVKIKDIKDKKGKIIDTEFETETRTYTIAFNINVIDLIDSKYKSGNKSGFDTFTERLGSSLERVQWNTATDFLCMCINEGIRIENDHRKEVGLDEIKPIRQEEINLDIMQAIHTAWSVLGEGLPESKN